MSKRNSRLLTSTSMILALSLLPGANPDAATTLVLDQDQQARIDQAVQAMLINLQTDPQLTPLHSGDWSLKIEREPELLSNFGAIFSIQNDQASRERGPLVLAVTPQSAASTLGLRTGDRIKSINASPLPDSATSDPQISPFERLQAALTALEDGQRLLLEVERNGNLVQLRGAMKRLRLPAVQLTLRGDSSAPTANLQAPEKATTRVACATVSMYQRPPPTAEQLHGAALVSINGKSLLHEMRDFQYLVPGRYTFLLNDDRIPERYLRLRHLKSSRGQRKAITLEVEDGMIYHLGARVLDEAEVPDSEREFWQPVVWRMEPGLCRGKAVAR